MPRSSRAPVLSATRRSDSCWITARRLPCNSCEGCGWWRSLCHLEHFSQAPALRLRQRPRLDDADDVADVRGVLLVVRVELDAAPDHLLVPRVRLDHVDLDHDRLVHRVGHDDAAALLGATALVLGLRLARDRLALRCALTRAPALVRAEGARQTLALLLRL